MRSALAALATGMVLATLGPAIASADPTVAGMLDKPHTSLLGVPNSFAGRIVKPAGDVNGDGHPDVLVVGNSVAWVVFGPITPGSSSLPVGGSGGFKMDATAIWHFFGVAAAGAGDVNGDGFDDIVIGVPSDNQNGRSGSGSAYVVYGSASPGDVDLSAPGLPGFRIDGAAAGDAVGRSVDGAGDVNGDGLDDLVVGTDNGGNQRTGRSAYVVFGSKSTATVLLNSATLGTRGFRMDGDESERPGVAVAGVGDVNHDGLADVLIGAPWADPLGRVNAGSAYLVLGRASRSTVSLSLGGAGVTRIDGAGPSQYLGAAVAAAGDVNGDGRPDLLIGAPSADDGSGPAGGPVYVVFSPVSGGVDLAQLGSGGLVVQAPGVPSGFGRYIASAGDVNGDGFADLLIGAPDFSGGAGAAYLVPGRATPGTIDATALGDAGRVITGSGVHLGEGVAGLGDVTGDGRVDIAVGAPRSVDGGAPSSGTTFVLSDLTQITLDIASGAPLARVSVRGSFFAPGETLRAQIGGMDAGSGTADARGAGSFAATVPDGATAGAAELRVTGAASGRSASSAFTVVAPAAITVSPDTVSPGQTVLVSGGRFAPGEFVDLRWDGGSAGPAVAGSNGQLASAPLVVPADATATDHVVVAVGDFSGRSTPATVHVRTVTWAQFGFTASHTGFNPYEALLTGQSIGRLTRRCLAPLAAPPILDSSPAVASGRVLVGGRDGTLHAIRTADCTEAWSASVGAGATTSPAVADGIVYASTGSTGLVAFDANSGRELWRTALHGGTPAAPMLSTGRVVAAHLDGTVESFARPSGVLQWSTSVGAGVQVAPGFGSDLVIVATTSGSVVALHAADGTPAWTRTGLPAAAGTPVLAGGRVLLTGVDGRLRALRVSDGGVSWTSPVDALAPAPPAVKDTTVLAGSQRGLEAINLSTGASLWTAALGAPATGAPAVAADVAYLPTCSVGTRLECAQQGYGVISAISLDRTHSWTGQGAVTPAVLNGRVYVPVEDGLAVYGLPG